MKTSTNKLSNISKALLFLAIFAMTVCFAFLFVACNNDDENEPKGNGDAVITKYDATLNASIRMADPEPVSFEDILSDTYITEANGKYTLTLIFKVGEITVAGATGSIFVDDNPEDSATVGGIENGTIGAYNKSGVLVTDGVTLTYSTGSDYQENFKHENVYYVKSAAMPIDTLRSEYSLTLYVNSAIMGKQFSNDSYNAKLVVDLDSGVAVTSISGLGVTTRGVVSADSNPDDDGDGDDNGDGDSENKEPVIPKDGETVKYDAEIYAGFMNDMYSFGSTLTAAYITNDDGEYTLTLTFGTDKLTIMTATANIFVYKSATASFGYYDDSESLVTDVELTYGKGYVLHSSDGYVSCVTSMTFPITQITDEYYVDIYFGSDFARGSMQYTKTPVTLDLTSGEVAETGVSGLGVATPLDAHKAVTSMTFTVDSVENTYNLAVYVTAFSATATSGMQFPYAGKNGITDAILTIDMNSAEEENGVTTYSATLDAVVAMGIENVNFTKNLVKNVVVKEVSGGYEITVNFDYGTVNMPYGSAMTGYMNGAANTDYFGNPVEPEYGYYVDGELVTDGVTVTYNTDDTQSN